MKIENEISEIQGRLRREPAEIKKLYQIAAKQLEAIEADLVKGTLAITDSESDLQLHIHAVNQMCRELKERLETLNKLKDERSISRQSESARLEREIARIQQELDKIVLPSALDYLALILGLRRNLSFI